MEQEIPHGPRLALALRARQSLLLIGAALGFAAAGATVVVGAQRGAASAFLARPDQPDCEFWDACPESWWEWPADKSPFDSPPTAILRSTRRFRNAGEPPV